GFVIAQVLFPLLPLYSIGYMLGTCVLHSYVLENEKEEYRGTLEQRLNDSVLKGNYQPLKVMNPVIDVSFPLGLPENRKFDFGDRVSVDPIKIEIAGERIARLISPAFAPVENDGDLRRVFHSVSYYTGKGDSVQYIPLSIAV
ncbi:MAG: hypothetical protein IJJ20_01120, partial [Thermoguttaceae bacterium]|nr:hypothetical protein [Thermoguttaceae bacterium]